jgi:hypothetical protein
MPLFHLCHEALVHLSSLTQREGIEPNLESSVCSYVFKICDRSPEYRIISSHALLTISSKEQTHFSGVSVCTLPPTDACFYSLLLSLQRTCQHVQIVAVTHLLHVSFVTWNGMKIRIRSGQLLQPFMPIGHSYAPHVSQNSFICWDGFL